MADEKEYPPGVSPLTGQAPPAWGKWRPGQSGNPEGGRQHKRYKLAIEIAMAKLSPAGDPMETEVGMAGAQLAKALQGHTEAYKELLDRLYGKVAQPIGGADDLGPVKISYGWQEPEKKPVEFGEWTPLSDPEKKPE